MNKRKRDSSSLIDKKCICGKEARYLCNDCTNISYCSKECSDLDWPNHEPSCVDLDIDALFEQMKKETFSLEKNSNIIIKTPVERRKELQWDYIKYHIMVHWIDVLLVIYDKLSKSGNLTSLVQVDTIFPFYGLQYIYIIYHKDYKDKLFANYSKNKTGSYIISNDFIVYGSDEKDGFFCNFVDVDIIKGYNQLTLRWEDGLVLNM